MTSAGSALDATITTASQAAVDRYGLDRLGFHVTSGAFPEWESSLVDAETAGTPVVLPVWRPYWLNQRYSLRALSDPHQVLRGANTVTLAAHAGVTRRLPPVSRQALERMRLTIDDVTDMDFTAATEHVSPDQAARRWIDGHRSQFDRWVGRLATGQPAAT